MLIKASDEWGKLIDRHDPKEVTIKIKDKETGTLKSINSQD